jgi:hypothetical protein
MGLIGWLITIGGLLISAALSCWGFTEVNKTFVIWGLGVPGALILIAAAGIELQQYAGGEKNSNEPNLVVSTASVLYRAQSFFISVAVKNAGKTTARGVTGYMKTGFRTPNVDFDFSPLAPADRTARTDVGPDISVTFNSRQMITVENTPGTVAARLAQLRDGTLELFAWGEVDYEDGFGNKTRLAFRNKVVQLADDNWYLRPVPIPD